MPAFVGNRKKIRLKHGHGSADSHHIIAQCPDLRWQELMLQAHRIENITHHGSEELAAHSSKQIGVVVEIFHCSAFTVLPLR